MGALTIVTATTGVEPDTDGYLVVVDATRTQAVAADGSVTMGGLQAGEHEVDLQGVAANCTVTGGPMVTVVVPSGETSEVSFQITCVSTTGAIGIRTTSSGRDIDYTGYRLLLDNEAALELGPNEERVLGPLSPGAHTVALSDVADNCVVAGGPSRSVEVVAAQQAHVEFEVQCELLGDLAIGSSGDIYLMFWDRPGIRRITQGPARDRAPKWSPDGRTIAFLTDRDGNEEIYLMNPDGSGIRNLTQDEASDRPREWSPDGTAISMISDRAGTDQVYWIDVATGRVTHVSRNSFRNRSASWSPDGQWLAFGAETEPDEFIWSIMIARRDGADQRALYTTEFFYGLDWSPVGSTILYIDDFELGALGTDGTLFDTYSDDCNGFFTSPSGSQIVVECGYSSPPLTKIHFARGQFQNEVGLCAQNPSCPDADWQPGPWSPDEQQILLTTTSGDYRLYVTSAARFATDSPRQLWDWGESWEAVGGADWRPE